MKPRSIIAVGALFSAVVVGTIVDRTTGQPLTGVDVAAEAAAHSAGARSDASGHFLLHGLAPGRHQLTLSSDDVPPQTFDVVVKSGKQLRFDMTACGTTLDYSCAAALP